MHMSRDGRGQHVYIQRTFETVYRNFGTRQFRAKLSNTGGSSGKIVVSHCIEEKQEPSWIEKLYTALIIKQKISPTRNLHSSFRHGLFLILK